MREVRNRANSFHLRLNDAELDRLLKQSAKAGIKPQAYIHALISGQQLREKPTSTNVQILKSLQQISNSMNQIALKTSTLNFVDTDAYWRNVDELKSAIRKLLEVIYG